VPAKASPTTVPQAFRFESAICRALGSELFADLLSRSAQDIEAKGPVARVVGDWRGDPLRDFVVLRMEDDGTRHPDIWLRMWPSGEDRHLAEAHNRGDWIRWLDGSSSDQPVDCRDRERL
jgi:hypothetical protein